MFCPFKFFPGLISQIILLHFLSQTCRQCWWPGPVAGSPCGGCGIITHPWGAGNSSRMLWLPGALTGLAQFTQYIIRVYVYICFTDLFQSIFINVLISSLPPKCFKFTIIAIPSVEAGKYSVPSSPNTHLDEGTKQKTHPNHQAMQNKSGINTC